MENKDLKALKIDRSRKDTASPARGWLLVLFGFFVGAVLMLVLFRTFLAGDDAGPVQANADPDRQAQSAGSGKGAQATEEDSEMPVLITSGYIVPHHRIEVGSKILGKIAWVGVEKSDKVERGQLLVKLSDEEFKAQLAQAGATLALAEARLSELQAGSRPEEIERARAEVNRARADLKNSELEFERLKTLLESKVVSWQEVDNAEARRDMASASLEVAEKNLNLALEGPRQEQIEQSRAEVERSRAAIQYWETQMAETEIRSPINGTVLERRAEVGEMVSTSFAGGATVIALADLNDLQVELDISQSDFRSISPENICRMSPIAYKDRVYDCEIAEIAPEANRQRATIQVKVQILHPDDFLRPEMDAQVTFYRPGGDEAPGK